MKCFDYETISIELTKRCNLQCPYCYASATNKNDALSLDIDQLKKFLPAFKGNGGRRVLFTGGEILLVDGIQNIVKMAADVGLIVDIFTNGTLIEKESAEWIAKYVNLVNVSLDGPELHHNRLRGRSSYQRTINGLKLLAEAGATIALQCMVTPDNETDFSWLSDLDGICSPVIIKLGNVSRIGRGIESKSLHLEKVTELKNRACLVSEELFHYHTRVITNIIDHDEWKMYYRNADKIITPWVLANGDILTCYVDRYWKYWTMSSISQYPQMDMVAQDRRTKLIAEVTKRCDRLPYFDIMEIVRDTAVELAIRDDNGGGQ